MAGAPQGTPLFQREDKLATIIALGDDNLILSQRLGEWISNAPELEIDIALGNLALDHLGVARALYTYAGEIEGLGRTEDDFAMKRTEREFMNVLLAEQPNGDFAVTIVRQVLMDIYQKLLWSSLAEDDDDTLSGIGQRAAKENAYHIEFSHGWLHRLAGGTDESHGRSQAAVDLLWRYTGELIEEVGAQWASETQRVLENAGLNVPEDPYQRSGGRSGFHTEHLGHLLTEMQWMDRTYPGLEW